MFWSKIYALKYCGNNIQIICVTMTEVNYSKVRESLQMQNKNNEIYYQEKNMVLFVYFNLE